MSIKNVGTNKWRVVVKVGIDPKTGKTKYADKIVNGSKAEAMTLEAKLSNGGIENPKAKMPLQAFINEIWLEQISVSPNTLAKYKSCSTNHINPAIGYVQLKSISPYTLTEFFNKLPEGSVRTNVRTTLSAALGKAVEWEILDRNPMERVKVSVGRENKRGYGTYSQEEVPAILEAVKGTDIEAGVLVMLFCGRRREEACGLDWEDIDLSTGEVGIKRAYVLVSDTGKALLKETKTETATSVSYVSGYAFERLKALGEGKTGPMMAYKGARLRPDLFYSRFKNTIEKKNLRYIPVGHLRHTFATIALSNGIDVAVVSNLLDHTKVSTTVNRYIKPLQEARVNASKAVSDIMMPS